VTGASVRCLEAVVRVSQYGVLPVFLRRMFYGLHGDCATGAFSANPLVAYSLEASTHHNVAVFRFPPAVLQRFGIGPRPAEGKSRAITYRTPKIITRAAIVPPENRRCPM